MRPPESFVGQPIRSLQTMLRFIAQQNPRQYSVIPDGIYGPDTVNAVTSFQRNAGLPITGVADQATWEAIVAAYEIAEIEQSPAEPLSIFFNPGQVIRSGETHPNLYLAQAILMVLSNEYSSITPPSINGTLDIPTANSLSSFQSLTLLPVTGELDKNTWRNLALQYPIAANLQTKQDTAPYQGITNPENTNFL